MHYTGLPEKPLAVQRYARSTYHHVPDNMCLLTNYRWHLGSDVYIVVTAGRALSGSRPGYHLAVTSIFPKYFFESF